MLFSCVTSWALNGSSSNFQTRLINKGSSPWREEEGKSCICWMTHLIEGMGWITFHISSSGEGLRRWMETITISWERCNDRVMSEEDDDFNIYGLIDMETAPKSFQSWTFKVILFNTLFLKDPFYSKVSKPKELQKQPSFICFHSVHFSFTAYRWHVRETFCDSPTSSGPHQPHPHITLPHRLHNSVA